MNLYVCMYTVFCVHSVPTKSEEVIRLLRTGVTDDCKPPMGAGDQSQVLCKSNKCSFFFLKINLLLCTYMVFCLHVYMSLGILVF